MSRYPKAEFLKSAPAAAAFLPDIGAEVAFVGRSNAGKSSALNALVERRGLARISKTPGRTQLVNFFGLTRDWRLVDLPGYGYAKVPEEVRRGWEHLVGTYFAGRRSLKGLFLIMDCRHPLTPGDDQLLAMARNVGCPVHVLLTKADKLKRGAAAATLRAVEKRLAGQATVQLFSATHRLGIDEARERLEAMLAA